MAKDHAIHQGKSEAKSAVPLEQNGLAWLTRWALYLALAVMLARGTLLEVLRDVFEAMPGGEATPRGPGPASGMVLDLLAALPALLVLVRRVFDPAFRLRFDWSHLAAGLLAGWALCSIAWSSDRFAAVVGASHFAAAIAALWATSQLVRTWREFRIVVGLCVGLFVAGLTQGIIYRYFERPALMEMVEAGRDRIIKERGLEPGSFESEQFLRKIERGEQVSFHASSNTLAAMMVLLGFVAVGAGIERIRRGEAAMGTAILLLLIPAGLLVHFAQSKTALATPVAGGALLGMVAILSRGSWLRERSRLLYFLGLGVVLAGMAAVVGHGLAHGSLPGASLDFRWQYWIGSARMAAARPILGVGYGNFGEHYLMYRLPRASEEIRDPHNLLVRSATELGAVGLALMAGWLMLLWWRMTRPVRPGAEWETTLRPMLDAAGQERANLRGLLPLAIPSILAGVIAIWAGVDFGIDNGWYISMEVIRRALYAGMFFLGAAATAMRVKPVAEIDPTPAPWMLRAAIVGLGLFIIHNLIDFSFYETGAMFPVCVLLGAVVGLRTEEHETGGQSGRARAAVALCVSLGAWLAVAVAVAGPIVTAEGDAVASDEMARLRRPVSALARMHEATEAVAYNADYALREARLLAADEAASPAVVDAAAARAVGRDPLYLGAYLFRARYARQITQTAPAGGASHWRGLAIDSYQRALAIDPANVGVRMEYSKMLEAMDDFGGAAVQLEESLRYSRAMDAANLKRNDTKVLLALVGVLERAGNKLAAKQRLKEALEYDESLVDDDPRRMTVEQAREIRSRLGRLGLPATTRAVKQSGPDSFLTARAGLRASMSNH